MLHNFLKKTKNSQESQLFVLLGLKFPWASPDFHESPSREGRKCRFLGPRRGVTENHELGGDRTEVHRGPICGFLSQKMVLAALAVGRFMKNPG